jgi:hypothetical protein
MAINKIFREIAIAKASKQARLIDAITEESPILANMPMEPASNGLQNVYEKVLDITAAQLVDLDGELPTVDMNTKLVQDDLSVIGGTMYVGIDKAKKMGGASAYFGKKLPSIMMATSAQTETSLIYNNFRKFAIDNGKVTDIGGSSAKNFSIVVVKWVPGEMTGLYDAQGFGNGKVLETIPLSGGNPFKKDFTLNGATKNLTVYGADFKTYFGVQLANERYCSAMVNIDIDSTTQKIPTEEQISNMLHQARANGSNTIIYMHPRLKTWLMKFKTSHLQMNVTDKNFDRMIDLWDGIPIVSSFNFYDGVEANV